MIITNRLFLLFGSLAALVFVGMGMATENPPLEDGGAPPVRSLLNMTPEQTAKLDPCNRAIRSLLIQERDAIAALVARMEEIRDPVEALGIQREIGARKEATEIGIMEVQAEYAEKAGRIEQAEAIREAVAGMKERSATTSNDAGAGE